jgi:tRNA (mo5U34)-methyltransferase
LGTLKASFSFEAERRGAAEVVALDRSYDHARKFHICKTALGSNVRSQIASVYDISPERFGTFDLVMFFGVLYHLRHPLLALEKIQAVCSGRLLMQTAICADTSDTPMAEFHHHGVESGPSDNRVCDTTCLWFPNAACCIGMLEHLGFKEPERLLTDAPVGRSLSGQIGKTNPRPSPASGENYLVLISCPMDSESHRDQLNTA